MIRRRWLLVLLDIVFLSALGGYVIAGLEEVPFHGDESSQIYLSRDYYTLFNDHNWSSIRVRGNLWRTREQYLRTMGGAINSYTIGLAWDLAGYSVHDINYSWRWNNNVQYPVDQWVYNLAYGNRPSNRLLYVSRISSTLFTVLSIVVLYLIARTLSGSRLAAWVACLIYATTPAILVNGRRATQEGALLFSTLLVILVAIQVIRVQARPAITWRRLGAWYLGLGAVSGFAVASKHSSATIIAAAFLTIGALPWLRMRENKAFNKVFLRRHYFTLVAAVLVMALVAIMLMPMWGSVPEFIILLGLIVLTLMIGFERSKAAQRALIAALVVTLVIFPMAWITIIAAPVGVTIARAYLMRGQAETNYHQDTVRERIENLIDQSFFAPTQYFENPIWANFEPIRVQIAAYENAHLDGRGGGVGWGLLLMALDGLGAWWLYVRRQQGINLLILGWLAIPAVSLLISPLAWQRYYILLIAPLSLVAGMGTLALLSLIRSRTAIIRVRNAAPPETLY
jgi:4-amino-4-deoxy-L-arabinose transferase-like glycosyltransferase